MIFAKIAFWEIVSAKIKINFDHSAWSARFCGVSAFEVSQHPPCPFCFGRIG